MASQASTANISSGVLKRRSTRIQLGRLLTYFLLIVGAIVTLFPFVWLVRSSFMEMSQIFIVPPEWIPRPFMWENYPQALTVVPFGLYFLNTF